ncbi:monocarboxylate transporter 12-like [Lingula anatina]|uniref:Monocarboxylate transporter 12-like n=1 Tax=Lingula anatina TaxID=7574 RepID=A0A1S3H6E3_LINAN|nr:monocarboxylate transporter 12-like [Lingula anatina]|eukprot:XP_013381568.1 monocarboxylate transporter 12-like [Lingula anatina]
MDDKPEVIKDNSRSVSENQPGNYNKSVESEGLNENDANISGDKIDSCEENTDKNCANSPIGNGYTYDNNHSGSINLSYVSDSNDSATYFTKIPEENVNNSNHYSVISNPVSNNDVNTESGDVSTNNADVHSKAPDGGWGWLVVLASFLLHVIVDGVSFSMGIFYVVFLDTFQETKSNTSWIGSILTAAMHLIALPAGMMCEKFGYRVVSISGSVIATVGFVLSAFAPSIYVLYVTLGAVVGIGFGLMFFPSVVCVQLYFDKKRSLAMGISVCGTGVGTFALAPFVRWLTDIIGWKYTMGVLAGITLTGSSLGMLYKPLRKREADEKADVMEILEGKETELEDNELSFGTKMVHLNETNQESKVGNLTTSFTKKTEDNSLKSTNIFTGLKQEVPEQSISIENERMEHKQMAKIHAEENTASSIDHTLSSALKENSSACCAKCSIDGAVGAIHWSLLRDPAFVVWLSCYFICQLGIIVPFTFIPDSAISRNIGAPEAAFLISIIGIVNTVTRLVTGIVADRKFIRHHRLQLLAFSVFIGGVALIMNPFCNTYATLAVDVVFTGISLGSFILLMPVVLRDLFGLEKMNSSIGFTLVIVGISTMLVPFLGWLTDVTGSYDITFYVTGGALVICSFVQAMLRRFQKKTYHPECTVPETTEDTRL